MDEPAAKVARTERAAVPARREGPAAISDAAAVGAASSARCPAGSSGSTSAHRGAQRHGHRPVLPVR